MAVNIFEQYGIKEVANVYFEALENDIKAGVYKGDIVLYLDSLKVSTIETTAENVAAQGGWGNPRLVMWDYGKEINVTLTDALISLESLRFMLGGAIKKSKNGSGTDATAVRVHHTLEVAADANGALPKLVDEYGKTWDSIGPASATNPIRVLNLTQGWRTQVVSGDITMGSTINFKNDSMGLTSSVPNSGDRIRIFWEEDVTTDDAAVEVTISPDTFPGTYKIVGDTFIRNTNGKDEPFQFIINKAKVNSQVTITLEAEGDPSTFEMTLNVLRDKSSGDDEMMKLVRYSVDGNGGTSSGNDDTTVGSV